jgi:hypothetical protein
MSDWADLGGSNINSLTAKDGYPPPITNDQLTKQINELQRTLALWQHTINLGCRTNLDRRELWKIMGGFPHQLEMLGNTYTKLQENIDEHIKNSKEKKGIHQYARDSLGEDYVKSKANFISYLKKLKSLPGIKKRWW